MNRLALAAVFACSLSAAVAGAQERVYRWVDSQGVVHYSQVPPAQIQSQARDIRTHEPPPAASPESTPEQRACQIAQANKVALDGPKVPMVDRDGDGKPEPMNAEERSAARDLNARQIAAFCRPAAAPAAAGTTRPPSG